MAYSTDLVRRVLCGDPEVENRRASRVDDLGEDVCRGDYRVPSQEIVAALMRDVTLSRLCPARTMFPFQTGG